MVEGTATGSAAGIVVRVMGAGVGVSAGFVGTDVVEATGGGAGEGVGWAGSALLGFGCGSTDASFVGGWF
jgi:hypothetical protein